MANLLVPMVPNQDLRAEFFNDSIDNMRSTAYQTADVSITNDAINFKASADLVIPNLVGGAEYIFESCLFYDTNSTADILINIKLPFIGLAMIAPWYSGSAITGSTNNINQQGQGASTATVVQFVAGGIAAGTVMCVRPVGWIRMSTSSGPLSIEFGQNAASTTGTILKQGSWIAITRVL